MKNLFAFLFCLVAFASVSQAQFYQSRPVFFSLNPQVYPIVPVQPVYPVTTVTQTLPVTTVTTSTYPQMVARTVGSPVKVFRGSIITSPPITLVETMQQVTTPVTVTTVHQPTLVETVQQATAPVTVTTVRSPIITTVDSPIITEVMADTVITTPAPVRVETVRSKTYKWIPGKWQEEK
jgi:hypothetical protein